MNCEILVQQVEDDRIVHYWIKTIDYIYEYPNIDHHSGTIKFETNGDIDLCFNEIFEIRFYNHDPTNPWEKSIISELNVLFNMKQNQFWKEQKDVRISIIKDIECNMINFK